MECTVAGVVWWFVCVMPSSMKCLWLETALDISIVFPKSPDNLML